MSLKKFLIFVLGSIISITILLFFAWDAYTSFDHKSEMETFNDHYRFTRIDGDDIQIFTEQKLWKDFDIKGIEVSSFSPQSSTNKTKIDSSELSQWFKDIQALNINTIKIPKIQAPSFYKTLYEFNEDNPNPLYTIHEIKLDEKAMLKHHIIFGSNIDKNFKKDIKRTLDVVHGEAILLNNQRGYNGIYLTDISKYNLAYILGGNTNPEIITLNNSKFEDKNNYDGNHYSIKNGKAFDVFVAENLDYLRDYEQTHYQQVSLLSYASNLETDALDYKEESNFTKAAKINLNKIKSRDSNNLFVAYKYHPNDVDFLDYESDHEVDFATNSFYEHLLRIKEFYDYPLLISDTGISSSQQASKLDLVDGYDRGGFTEEEQGEKIVELLKSIHQADLSGFVLNSWQDNWSQKTSFNMIEDHRDISASTYWQNVMASDENFGLMKFEAEEPFDSIQIDGDFRDWDTIDFLLDEEVRFKVDSDTDYLYLYLESQNTITKNNFYLGIDVNKKSGSQVWKEKNLHFSLPVDFILDFNHLENPQVFVHDRYDLFSYLYKYYSSDVGRQNHKPDMDAKHFSPIYSLHRKSFHYASNSSIVDPIYSNTGYLLEGNTDSNAQSFNSNANFQYNDHAVELRIPFSMLNIVNPIDMLAYGNFYDYGLDDKINIGSLGFSIYDKSLDASYEIESRYKQKNFRDIKYKTRLKASYKIVQDYLKTRN